MSSRKRRADEGEERRERPSFEPSGRLAKDTRDSHSRHRKYNDNNDSPEARIPSRRRRTDEEREERNEKPTFEPSGKLAKDTNSFKREYNNYNEPSGASSSSRKKPGEGEEEREKPSFEPSGKLAKDTNTFKGVLIKYNEPPEAKIPKLRWRMYPFKGEEELPVIYIHRQSAYLVGRDRKVADFPVDHPSCSKQHAAIQYRSMPYERPDGTRGRRTRPYLIDLGSANGTYLNGTKLEAQRYYELKENDLVRFGFSSKEYVMLHEQSLRGTEEDEDTGSEEEEDEVDGGLIDQAGGEEKLAATEEDDLF